MAKVKTALIHRRETSVTFTLGEIEKILEREAGAVANGEGAPLLANFVREYSVHFDLSDPLRVKAEVFLTDTRREP